MTEPLSERSPLRAGGGSSADPRRNGPPRADATPRAASATSPSPAERSALLWLAMSQRIAGRAAHEVKNALNAVAVNLEVVRSRLARAAADPGATPQPSPAAAARFADVASAQFEGLSALTEAMLALTRAPREPADVVHLLAPLVVVFDAVARSDGGSLRVSGADGGAAVPVSVPAVAVRLALAAALDAAVGRARAVVCAVDGTSVPARVHLSWLGAVAAPPVPADLVAVVGDCGITIAPDDATSAAGALTIVFDGADAMHPRVADAAPSARPRGDASPTQDQ